MTKLRENKSPALLLLAYAGITLVSLFHHELWFDEAQAWVISRDLTPKGIVALMSYEGHSSLWHFILYPFSHAGFSVISMQLISWLFMCSAGYLLLFHSPFPMYSKAIVLFSAGFLYTNVTVARVYSLIPLLIFLLAMLYPKRHNHPIAYGFLLAVLANTHVIMAGFVGFLGIFMFIDFIGSFRKVSKKSNLSTILGLIIGGSGCLLFFLQVNDAMSTNTATNQKQLSIFSLFRDTVLGIPRWLMNLVDTYDILRNNKILFYLVFLLLFAMIILFMKHLYKVAKRSFFLLIVSLLVIFVINSAIWAFIPNRSTMMLVIFLFCLWIEHEKVNKMMYVSLMVLFVATYPIGIYSIVSDYTASFDGAKETAEYIEKNFDKNSVFLTAHDNFGTTLSAYNKNIQFYDLSKHRFYTYCHHDDNYMNQLNAQAAVDQINQYFFNTKNLYLIHSHYESSSEHSDIVRYQAPLVIKGNSFDGISYAIYNFDKAANKDIIKGASPQ